MIIQIGALFSNLFEGITAGATALGQQFLPEVLNVGRQFTTSLINRELNRDAVNAIQDRQKAQLRAAANAVSPTAAAGQTAVPAGGPAIGTAFMPATVVPPSIQPPQRVLQTDPDFFPRNRGQQFQTSRRPEALFVSGGATGDFGIPVRQAGFGTAAANLIRRGVQQMTGRGRTIARSFDPRTVTGREMLALQGANVAGQAALSLGADALFFPSVAGEDQFGSFPTEGDPLRIGATVPTQTATPTGLPSRGVYQREPNGFQVQWYAMMGGQLQPITRGQAECLKRDCIYRLNVFTGDFQKLRSRRMNPMNTRAFFRAGRRVDAGERICRKMFSEHRKKKTGAIRRKSRKKKR